LGSGERFGCVKMQVKLSQIWSGSFGCYSGFSSVLSVAQTTKATGVNVTVIIVILWSSCPGPPLVLGCMGAIENAGAQNAIRAKLQGWKMHFSVPPCVKQRFRDDVCGGECSA